MDDSLCISSRKLIYSIVVDENLRLVEAQLNSFRAKKESILDAGALSTSDPQVNDKHLQQMIAVWRIYRFLENIHICNQSAVRVDKYGICYFMQLCLISILYILVNWTVSLKSIFEKVAICQLPKCIYKVSKNDGFPFMVKSVCAD